MIEFAEFLNPQWERTVGAQYFLKVNIRELETLSKKY